MIDVSRRRLWLTMLSLTMAELLSTLEAGMIYVALPTIAMQFRNLGDVSWLITSFVLVQAGTAAVAGRIGDLLGRRRVLVVILGMCALGSAISANSIQLGWIIAGRALQGVSGAVLPLCYGITQDVVPRNELPFWIGFLTATNGASGAIAFVLGGFLVQHATWHWIFYVTLGLPLITIPLVLSFVAPSTPRPPSVKRDIFGGLLFVPAVAGILLAATKGSQWGWTSMLFAGVLASSLLVIVVWLINELRHPEPLIDIRLFLNRQITLANACFILLGLGQMQLSLVAMLLLQQPAWTGVGLNVSATVAALLFLPGTAGSAVASVYGGWLTIRRGARTTAVIGANILTIAWAALALFHANIWPVMLELMGSGVGTGLVMSAVPNLVLAVAPAERSSEVTGMTFVVRAVFWAIGGQIVVALLNIDTVHDPTGSGKGYPSQSAYLAAIGCIVLVNTFMVVLALALPSQSDRWRMGTTLLTLRRSLFQDKP